jgi:tRNA threonylcarbamoyladenosine biosynthesis protein TsaE
MPKTSSTECLHLRLDSVLKTLQFGERLGTLLEGGDVLALMGDLGTGKTVLARGIALGVGIPPEQVTSPTFTLIQAYKGRIPVIHADLYRLEGQVDTLSLGLHEYFTQQNIVIIEWADRFFPSLPPDHLTIQLAHGDTEDIRLLQLQGTGARNKHILEVLQLEMQSN